jgi:hypothetical protein
MEKDSVMSIPTTRPPNQAVRCGDRNHKASIARQRKAATASPRQQAEAIAKVVRKRLSDGQTPPDLDKYRLDDQTWGELLEVLDAHELSLVADACGGDDLGGDEDEPRANDITQAFEDDAPVIPSDTIPPAPQHTPSWRDHEPAIVHSLKWRDADGLEHLHVIRADTIDEALVHIKKLKLCIAAAKTKAQAQAVDTKEPGSVSPRRYAIHDAEMTRRTSKKTGKLYSAHDTAEGLCFGRKI